MPFLVKPKDMGTAELEDLRYSKKRCDRLRNIFCGGSCIGYALNLILGLVQFPGYLVMPTSELLRVFAMMLLSAAGIVTEILAKEQSKCYVFTYVARFLLILLDDHMSLITLAAIQAFFTLYTVLAHILSVYNERLSEVDGYPYFTRHMENIRNEGMTREQVKAQYSGNGIVDPEEFFTKKTMEELHAADEKSKEIDKSDWLGS